MATDLLQHLREYVKSQQLFTPASKLLLALSGGVDSVVLCHLLRETGFQFEIAHCNFKLRGAESEKGEVFVKDLASAYHVNYHGISFDTRAVAAAQKKSIEETARDLRYEWFHQLLRDHSLEYIVTAHHADDNIETIAMKFFRGTGIKGLRGMLPKNGKIIRPLLTIRKKDLEAYAAQHELMVAPDSSNNDDIYTRNFFRNQLFPLLKEIYPNVEQNLLNNQERFAGVEELYEQAMAMHRKKLMEQRGDEVHIPVKKLRKSSPLKTIVYEIASGFGFTAQQAEGIIGLLDSETGKWISSGTHRIFRNRDWLIISPLSATASSHLLIEEDKAAIDFPDGHLRFQLSEADSFGPSPDSAIAAIDQRLLKYPLLLRRWKPGDYFYPLGMKKKKKLARFFIDQKMSMTDKEKIWVLESDNRIVWIVGQRIDDRFKITPQTKKIVQISLAKK